MSYIFVQNFILPHVGLPRDQNDIKENLTLTSVAKSSKTLARSWKRQTLAKIWNKLNKKLKSAS